MSIKRLLLERKHVFQELSTYWRRKSNVCTLPPFPQVPIKTALAERFGVFNRLFSSVPGFSAPNHMMMQSATSCGAAPGSPA